MFENYFLYAERFFRVRKEYRVTVWMTVWEGQNDPKKGQNVDFCNMPKMRQKGSAPSRANAPL